MSNKSNILARIKELFYEEKMAKDFTTSNGEIKEINEYIVEEKMEETIVEEKMEEKMEEKIEEKMGSIVETKLSDGTVVRVIVAGEQIAIGDKVEVKDAEGTFVKAPEGRHETVEGLILYVDAEGLINEIETKETEEMGKKEEDSMNSIFESVNSFKATIDEIKKSLESIKNENKELREKFKMFAAEPSATSITKSTPTISRTESREGKLKFFGSK
jgi:hypothetical protein